MGYRFATALATLALLGAAGAPAEPAGTITLRWNATNNPAAAVHVDDHHRAGGPYIIHASLSATPNTMVTTCVQPTNESSPPRCTRGSGESIDVDPSRLGTRAQPITITIIPN